MDYLLEVAQEFGLGRIVDRALEIPSVQGVVVDLDPYWLSAWQRHISGMDDVFLGPDERLRYYRYGVEEPTQYRPVSRYDLEWRPNFWRYFRETQLGFNDTDSPPLVVKVCFEPNAESPKEPKFGSERLRVVLEYRPIARLAAKPKDQVRPLVGGLSVGTGAKSAGTLGGILRNANGNSFALTCAHVLPNQAPADQPAQRDSSNASFIGPVVLTSNLRPSPHSKVCNPYHPANVMNELDLALIELVPGIQTNQEVLHVGPINGRAARANISPGLPVELTGRTSGYRALRVGGITATYRFRDSSGEVYCFEKLFELRWPRFSSLILRRPVKGGDSGAWVCSQGNTGTEWCGVVVGEDRLQGYAAFSETIVTWIQNNGYNVDCF